MLMLSNPNQARVTVGHVLSFQSKMSWVREVKTDSGFGSGVGRSGEAVPGGERSKRAPVMEWGEGRGYKQCKVGGKGMYYQVCCVLWRNAHMSMSPGMQSPSQRYNITKF